MATDGFLPGIAGWDKAAVAAARPPRAGRIGGPRSLVRACPTLLVGFCGAGSPTVLEFLGQIDRQLTEFAPLLKLAAPNKTLVDAYQEMILVIMQ